MAYPNQTSPFLRSGWVANQLIPNPDYHASALTFLGGSPASNPQVSGTPQVSGSTLQTPPASLGGFGAPQQQTTNFPAWLTSLLSQMGMSGMGNEKVNPVNPAVLPKAPALEQVASTAPASSQYHTPQFGSTAKKKKGGLFSTLLDLSPGSPTIFGIGG